MTTASSPVGYRDLVRGNPRYRLLWLGEIVSLLGDWFNLIASAALIARLGGSGLAISTLLAIRMLAPFVISPLAGIWADRYNRRDLLILTDILRSMIVFCFLLVRDPGDIWVLYLLTALQFALTGIFFPTRNAILPDIVSDRELGAANALSSGTWSVMLAVGAALGGLSAGTLGIYPSFVIDGCTYLLSAGLLSRIRYRRHELEESDTGVRAAVGRYLRGLRYLNDHRDILAIASLKAASAFAIGGPFEVVQVIVAEQVFPIGKGGGTSLGLIYAMVGLGTGIGPIVVRRFTGDREWPLRVAIVGAYVSAALGLAIVAPLSAFALVLVGTLVRGIGAGVNWVFSAQLLLQRLPSEVRGRVFASEFALSTLGGALGAWAAGWLLDQTTLGVSGLLWLLSGTALVPGVLWALWIVRRRRNA